MAALKGPRFAPEDPTLPKPWRALIDSNTGYMYFWNPITKVTQYQKPSNSDVVCATSEAKSENVDVASNDDRKENDKDEPAKFEEKECDMHVEESKESIDKHGSSNMDTHTFAEEPMNTDDLSASRKPSLTHGSSNIDAPGSTECPIDNKPYMSTPASIKESSNDQEKSIASTPGSTEEPIKNHESPKLNASASAEESLNNHGSSNVSTPASTEKPSNDNKSSNARTCAYVEDPTLPRPWRALIDQKTGYMYFWNPETKITQYQRPTPVVHDDTNNISQIPLNYNRSFISEELQQEQDHEEYSPKGSKERVKDEFAKDEEKECDMHVEESKESVDKHGSSNVDTHTSAEEPMNTDDLSASWEPLLTHGSSNADAPGSIEHFIDNHGSSDMGTPASRKKSSNDQDKSVASTPGSTEEPIKNHESPKLNASASAEVSFNNHGSSNVGTPASTEKPSNGDKSSNAGTRAYVEDPTLPKPWRALIDRKTGYMYFWNPETKVTQYQRPTQVVNNDINNISHKPSNYNRSFVSEKLEQEQDHDEYSLKGSEEHVKGDLVNVEDGMHVEEINKEPFKTQGSTNMCTPSDAEAYRRQHEIKVTGNVPHPFTTFESTGFPSELLREVLRAGFKAPTPIQAQSWPIAMQNRDIVAVAKTGSGKTLGYLIPAFIHLKRLQSDSKDGPRVLVLSPTRELATQIHDEAEKFGSSSRVSAVCLYGGAPKGPQLRDLDKGADVVIATPGRLNDILEMKRVSLHQISYLVLDEADRMLDMGFEPQIRKILSAVQPRRQTLMFTATWPKEVRKIAAEFLNKPVQVNIGNIDELVANKSITQYVEVISYMEKRRRLEQIIRSQQPGSKIIVFCATKKMCDQIARTLADQFGAAAIHGDKSQSERDSILSQFRTGRSPVLVATDVAARGLDVKDIRIVVNYDFPTGIEDYVHRIGRTGRAGSTGEAYTFFSDQDARYASELVKILEGANQKVPPELRQLVSRGGYSGGGYSKFRRTDGGGSYGSGGGRGYGGGGGGGYSSGGGGFGSGGNNGSGGFGSNARNDNAPSWSQEKMMGAGAGANRSRSRSPVGNKSGGGWGSSGGWSSGGW